MRKLIAQLSNFCIATEPTKTYIFSGYVRWVYFRYSAQENDKAHRIETVSPFKIVIAAISVLQN